MRYFDFSDPGYNFPSLAELRSQWERLPDNQAIDAVAEAHQYYHFLRTMIVDRVQSWSHSPQERAHWHTPTPLTLSARAGAISSAVVVGTSIVECALRSHAQARNLRDLRKVNPEHRTLGKVISVWERHGTYGREIASVVGYLRTLQSNRNNIHLYASFGRNWQIVIEEENRLLHISDELISFLQRLSVQ